MLSASMFKIGLFTPSCTRQELVIHNRIDIIDSVNPALPQTFAALKFVRQQLVIILRTQN